MPPYTLTLCNTSLISVRNFTSFKPVKKCVLVLQPRERKKKRSILSIVKTSSNGFGIVHRRSFFSITTASSGGGGSASESGDGLRKVAQAALWIAEGVYIFWLFLLPYAPGDPIWAITSETINSLIGLSLNFFFILPLLNSIGVHLIESPVFHPMSEGLFNFVIGWTFMFAPMLFTDKNRDRYKGSLDVLWGFQLFLTNTFLIPYMAIRMNERDSGSIPSKNSRLGSIMTNGAPVVGLVGGIVCVVSILWAVYGRGDGDFGDLSRRWEFFVGYLGSERLAYAFIWDICLYAVFQPWLIGENLQNIRKDRVSLANFLRFVPFVGITIYCLFLNVDEEM